MNNLGKQLIYLRNQKGFSQEKLAEKSNVNLRTIQRIENNETSPRKSTLELICNALEISISDVSLKFENKNKKNILTVIFQYCFLIFLGFATMGVFGFLTMDTSANFNSRLGALIISFFLPSTIVLLTKKMASGERLLKFGFGYVIHFILMFFASEFGRAWTVGIHSLLFPCILISILVLFYGDKFLPQND